MLGLSDTFRQEAPRLGDELRAGAMHIRGW